MALSLTSSRSRGTTGLDIDGRFLAAAQTSNGQIVGGASAELPPGVVHDGEIMDVEGLAQALRAFFGTYDFPKKVRLGVSNQQIAVRHLELPAIDDDREREAAVRFQAADAIAMPLDEAILDHHVLYQEASPDGAERQHVVVVAARRAMIQRFVDTIREAGLKPAGIDLAAFALVRTLAPAPSGFEFGAVPDHGAARVYCHLGGVTNLAVAQGNNCLFTRPLSTASDDASDNVVAELAEEIRLSIDFYMAQAGAQPVSDVALSGPGAYGEGVAQRLEQFIGVPVSVADPLGGRDRGALPPEEDPSRYTVAVGLARGED